MEKQKYIEDIEAIKDIMDRSSRFISLSGMSGVLAGIFALIAAYFAYETIYSGQDYMEYRKAVLTVSSLTQLMGIALITVVLSVGCGIYLTTPKEVLPSLRPSHLSSTASPWSMEASILSAL